MEMRYLIDLVETADFEEAMRLGILINPSRGELSKLLGESEGIGRMYIDDNGDVYIWNSYHYIHHNVAKSLNLMMKSKENPLIGLSLYAFKNDIAARVYEVGDEEEHPALTAAARSLPNVVRIWGQNVVCVDMHGEP